MTKVFDARKRTNVDSRVKEFQLETEEKPLFEVSEPPKIVFSAPLKPINLGFENGVAAVPEKIEDYSDFKYDEAVSLNDGQVETSVSAKFKFDEARSLKDNQFETSMKFSAKCPNLEDPKLAPGVSAAAKKPSDETNKGIAVQWKCKECLATHSTDTKFCPACKEEKDKVKGPIAQTPSLIEIFKLKPTSTENKEKATAPNKTETKSLDVFKPKPGSWNCQECYVPNPAENVKCVACTSPKPDSVPLVPKQPAILVSTDAFKPKLGKWTCSECWVSNEESVSNCVSCSASKHGAEKPSQETISSTKDLNAKAVSKSTNVAAPFQFGVHIESKDSDKAVQKNDISIFKFGVPTTTTTTPAFVNFRSGVGIKPAQPDISNFQVSSEAPFLKRKLEDVKEIEVPVADKNANIIEKDLKRLDSSVTIETPGKHAELQEKVTSSSQTPLLSTDGKMTFGATSFGSKLESSEHNTVKKEQVECQRQLEAPKSLQFGIQTEDSKKITPQNLFSFGVPTSAVKEENVPLISGTATTTIDDFLAPSSALPVTPSITTKTDASTFGGMSAVAINEPSRPPNIFGAVSTLQPTPFGTPSAPSFNFKAQEAVQAGIVSTIDSGKSEGQLPSKDFSRLTETHKSAETSLFGGTSTPVSGFSFGKTEAITSLKDSTTASTAVFSAPTSTTSQAVFSSESKTSSVFGSNSTPISSASAFSMPAGAILGGSKSQMASAPVFGTKTVPVFGLSSTQSSSMPSFGAPGVSAPSFGGVGNPALTTSMFDSRKPSFGSALTSGGTPFGSTQTSGFGSTSQALSTSSAVLQPLNTPSTTVSPFGIPAVPVFGFNAPSFGGAAHFGASTQTSTVFGASSSTTLAFGTAPSNTTAFNTGSTHTFGSTSAASSTFGTGSVFGPTTSAPSFKAGATASPFGINTFKPTAEPAKQGVPVSNRRNEFFVRGCFTGNFLNLFP